MLRDAFNTLTRLHSREAQVIRRGDLEIYSPCRLTPSNYFRYLRGPDTTVIRGREFVIPVDSLLGHFTQTLAFAEAPVEGTFKLSYDSEASIDIAWDLPAADIQLILRVVPGLRDVEVSGSIAVGLIVVFPGFATQPLILVATDATTLLDTDGEAVLITIARSFTAWTVRMKRSDKIQDSVFGLLTVDEVEEMVDLGGATMGYRIRAE